MKVKKVNVWDNDLEDYRVMYYRDPSFGVLITVLMYGGIALGGLFFEAFLGWAFVICVLFGLLWIIPLAGFCSWTDRHFKSEEACERYWKGWKK